MKFITHILLTLWAITLLSPLATSFAKETVYTYPIETVSVVFSGNSATLSTKIQATSFTVVIRSHEILTEDTGVVLESNGLSKLASLEVE